MIRMIHSAALVVLAIVAAVKLPSTSGFAPPSNSIKVGGRTTPVSFPLQVANSPTSFVSDVVKKFGIGSIASGNGDSTRDDLANQLIESCKKLGQVGSKLSEEERADIDNITNLLSAFSDSSPSKFDLKGNHELVYSASPGGSSGAIGPFVGKVTQSFLDEEKFINRVELLNGVFKVELNAERKVLDDTRIRVMFKQTVVSLFGNEVVRKDVKGQGVWKYIFAGVVNLPREDGLDGEVEKVFLRVLKTPSTFVIIQRLP